MLVEHVPNGSPKAPAHFNTSTYIDAHTDYGNDGISAASQFDQNATYFSSVEQYIVRPLQRNAGNP